jgi:hypothetical protein
MNTVPTVPVPVPQPCLPEWIHTEITVPFLALLLIPRKAGGSDHPAAGSALQRQHEASLSSRGHHDGAGRLH